MHRKGQGNITAIFVTGVVTAIAFAVFVIALSLIGQIITTNQDTQATASTEFTTVNESFPLAANGTLANVDILHFGNAAIDNTSVLVTNKTLLDTNVLVQGTDYTVLGDGTINFTNPISVGPVNVTYNSSNFIASTAFNVSADGLSGASNISDLVPMMGLIFGILLVLGLLIGLLVMFKFGRR